jgi:hypothetical protein
LRAAPAAAGGRRIHRHYQRVGRLLGFGTIPGPPQAKPIIVVVPVSQVSLLTRHAISEALSISPHVIAVTVVAADPDPSTGHADSLCQPWDRWNQGVPLQVLHTQYPSIAGPVVTFIDKLGQQHEDQIIVLIPGRAPRPAARPTPAQPDRPRPHQGAADLHRYRTDAR